jgi:SAM-dependent methyltransferase
MTARGTLHYNAVFRRRVRVLARHLAGLLPRDARVLDVGCGNGAVAAALMERRSDLTVTGIDVLVQPDARIPVEQFDGSTLPLEDDSVDAVMFVDVLHHTPDPTTLLREARRVTEQCVVIKDHITAGPLARPRLRLMDWVGNAHLGIALPYNYWPKERWDAAFAEVGLRVERWIDALGLYPAPASWLFDAKLHMVCQLTKQG